MDGDAVEVVHPPGTREARSVGGPGCVWPGGIRIEHCVIDHELATFTKHVVQGHLPTLALEGVVLFHQLPWKSPALATQLVAHARELLFFRQVLLATHHPPPPATP